MIFYGTLLVLWILVLFTVRERLLSSIHIHSIWKDRKDCIFSPKDDYDSQNVESESIEIERNSDIICIDDDDIETINTNDSLTTENL